MSPFDVGGASESDIANEISELGPNFTGPKKLKETDERNSLSNAPVEWKRYTDTLTAKTRERASSIFEGLRQRFPEDDPNEIAACPENLRTFGAPDGTPWIEIKSPHGLMESAWPQLRDFFRAKVGARKRAEDAAARQAQERELSAVTASKEDEERIADAVRVRAAFDAELANDEARAQALDRFKPAWVSNAQVEPGRSLAIDGWFRKCGAQ